MKRVLLTGFEPFGGDQRNPSLEAVRLVEKRHQPANYELHVSQLPVEFGKSGDVLRHAIDEISPDIVVCVGLAAGRTDLSFERVAINIADARIADNAGASPVDAPLSANGAPAYFSTLPNKRAIEDLRAAGIPASLSNTAGTYVCNAALFYVLQALEGTRARGTFIHVPDAFGPNPPMSVEEIAQGLELALKTFVSHTEELTVTMGTEF